MFNRRIVPAVLAVAASLTTAQSFAQSTGWIASNLTPAGYSEARFLGAGGGQAVGDASRIAPALFVQDARASNALLWREATRSTVNLNPGNGGVPGIQFVSLNQAFGTNGSVQVGTVDAFLSSQVIGEETSRDYAAVWSGSAGSLTLLNPEGTEAASGRDTNGTAFVGSARPVGGSAIPYFWSSTTAPGISLPGPTAAPFDGPDYVYFGQASAISGNRIVGTVEDNVAFRAAAYWSSSSADPQILRPAGFDESTAIAIEGDTVLLDLAAANRHAYLYNISSGNFTSLQPADTSVVNSYGAALSGPTVVGGVAVTDFENPGETLEQAAVWSNGTAGSYVNLQSTLPDDYTFSFARGIDAAGNIYGNAANRFRENRAIRWSPGTATSATWTGGSGSWELSANWSAAIPSGTAATAFFGDATLTTDTTVSLTAPRTLGRLDLAANGDLNYVIAGPAALTLQGFNGGHGLVRVSNGAHEISAPIVLAGTTDFFVREGAIRAFDAELTLSGILSGPGDFQIEGGGIVRLLAQPTYQGLTYVSRGLLIASAPLRTPGQPLLVGPRDQSADARAGVTLGAPAAPGSNVVVGEFSSILIGADATVLIPTTDRSTNRPTVLISGPIEVDQSGFLDLTNNDLIVRSSNVDAVRTLVAHWFNNRSGLLFDQVGLVGLGTSDTDVSIPITLAVFPNAITEDLPYFTTYDGVQLGASDVIVKYTYFGDTNLDGVVNGTDIANLIEGYTLGLTGWNNGDFNYDGLVDGSDFVLLNFTLGFPGLPSLGNGSGGSETSGVVPEPATLGLLAATVPLLSRRRRR